MSCQIATWNVNSLRARMDAVCTWLAQSAVDVLALQETKVIDADFPSEPLENLGYQLYFTGQKSYNGVAILSKQPATDVMYAPPHSTDTAKRFMAATIAGIRVVNVYVPNGQSLDSDKYLYKMQWLDHLIEYLTEARQHYEKILLLGDFNIAPSDLDVHDPVYWQNRILVSPQEREKLQQIQALGFHDLFRQHHPDSAGFSWWDYRAGGFRRGHGLRIDLLLASTALQMDLADIQVDIAPRGWDKPSDHTPVYAKFH